MSLRYDSQCFFPLLTVGVPSSSGISAREHDTHPAHDSLLSKAIPIQQIRRNLPSISARFFITVEWSKMFIAVETHTSHLLYTVKS